MEESWSELFLLWIIQYSISFNNEDLIFRNVQLINDVFDIFKQLKVNPMEFTCLKAIVLFRFGRMNEKFFFLWKQILVL
jgi:hypothetical protein